jgi:hypothetical protein
VTKDIAIYIEGGGDTAESLAPFRRGMSEFLKPIVEEIRKRRIRWRVIACGGRQQAYDDFVDALVKEPHVHNFLLVDSEDPVAITTSPWEHVNQREGDKWDKPNGADDACLQMMVACMEGWFLADPAALKRHFGGNFNEKALPPANQAETRSKDKIVDALKKATKPTKATEYQKIRDGAELLKIINSDEVRKHCKWCERLFKALQQALGAAPGLDSNA